MSTMATITVSTLPAFTVRLSSSRLRLPGMLGPLPYIPMPPPPLLTADARSIQLFSSCTGVRAIGGFLRRTGCALEASKRCAAGWRARAFLAQALSPQTQSATALSIAIAGDPPMRTSIKPARARSHQSRAIGGSRPQLGCRARVLGRALDFAGERLRGVAAPTRIVQP